jgi:SAM-dependent methyltransferase
VNVSSIPIVAVSYNAPDLIETLLLSLQQFYSNPIYIIDGSVDEVAPDIEAITQRYPDVQFHGFGYNIHHGPGITWAVHHLNLSGPVLFLDSDVEVVKPGMIESLLSHLKPHLYGVGDISYPQLADTPAQYRGIPYLSPACMLCNVEVMRQWPMPIRHGAPMVVPMQALHVAGQSDLVQQVDWVKNDFAEGTVSVYLRHDWQGTVRRTGGYHYDAEPASSDYNQDLLGLLPTTAYNVVDLGCGNGNFARAYKRVNPVCHYTGVDRAIEAIRFARKPCDSTYHLDIEALDADFFARSRTVDAWVLDGALECVRDPWALLQKIRAVLPVQGCIVASIANVQHWSVQARLNNGASAGVASGLLPREQLHGFGRNSMIELFQSAGLQLVQGAARVAGDNGERFMPVIRQMAAMSGANPEQAVQDAQAVQYLVKAVAA